MSSVKVKFRTSGRKGKEGKIYYQVIHRRVVRQIVTDYRIFRKEWNERLSVLKPDSARREERRGYLAQLQERIDRDVGRIERIAGRLKGEGRCTADDIVRGFHVARKGQSFFLFMKNVIARLRQLGRDRTAENYVSALNSFMRFREYRDLPLDEMAPDLIQEYEAYLKARGVVLNTVSFYMRILRAVYNRAVEQGVTEQRAPFRHVYTGIDKTVKRALSLTEIRRIKELELSGLPALEFARDMFLFSFYTRGMSFVDMAHLKKSDLRNGILTYRRQKTGQLLSIRWEKPMRELVGKYARTTRTSPRLLPILTEAEDSRQEYRNRLCAVNHDLKRVAKLLRLPQRLTTYVARHSWASVAKRKNIPLAVISEGMGHDSEMTTRIYLASLECAVIDKANSLILKDL